MTLMCEAFIDAVEGKKTDWELWCIGTGDRWEARVIHPQIKHIGFVQPGDMAEYVRQTGVFVLPSLIENWGVAVQELAAAGFPLICSERVGAASEFLQKGENGFLFHPQKKEELIAIFRQVITMTSEELNRMGKISHNQAQKITPETWAKTLYTFQLDKSCAE
jgi:glycosyltransferase involved in cell wall biosynthesis